MSEVLVILKGSDLEAVLRQVEVHGKVTNVASGRVVVMEVPAGHSEEIRALPGVVQATTEAVTLSTLEDLDEQEALFVAAWNLRRDQPEKIREGEGMEWDAPGFEPPDMPAHA